MSKMQLNLRLDEGLNARLERLAERTGRSKAFYAAEAITEFLDEREDYFMAKDALEKFRQSDDSAIVFEDVNWDHLGR